MKEERRKKGWTDFATVAANMSWLLTDVLDISPSLPGAFAGTSGLKQVGIGKEERKKKKEKKREKEKKSPSSSHCFFFAPDNHKHNQPTKYF